MSLKIKFTTDRGSDVSLPIASKYDIFVFDQHVLTEKGEFIDMVEITQFNIISLIEEKQKLSVMTPSIIGYIEKFSEFINDGYHVIHLSQSSKISPGFSIACQSKEKLGLLGADVSKINVIDTTLFSAGIGFLLNSVCKELYSLSTVDEVVDFIHSLMEKITVSFLCYDTINGDEQSDSIFKAISQFSANSTTFYSVDCENGVLTNSKKYSGNPINCFRKFTAGRHKKIKIINAISLLTFGNDFEFYNECADYLQNDLGIDNVNVYKSSTSTGVIVGTKFVCIVFVTL